MAQRCIRRFRRCIALARRRRDRADGTTTNPVACCTPLPRRSCCARVVTVGTVLRRPLQRYHDYRGVDGRGWPLPICDDADDPAKVDARTERSGERKPEIATVTNESRR